MTVDLYARKKFELNISHVFVETMLNTMSLFSKQTEVSLVVAGVRGICFSNIFLERTSFKK
jgi:hypothetical protein